MCGSSISRSWGFILLGSAAFLAAGCRNDVAAQQVQTAATSATPGEAAVPAAAPSGEATPAKPRFDEAAFAVEMRADSALKVGASGEITVSLVAKPPFHVNAEYPHRFKVGSVKGGTPGSTVVTREPSKVEPGKLSLAVPVTASEAGTGQIDGELFFSLCTVDKCLMEKRRLTCEFKAN